MARIVLADDAIPFDGDSVYRGPLGGVESAICYLTTELASRGHEVLVRNMCTRPRTIRGVDWAPLTSGLPETADLYIANRGDELLLRMPRARRTVFWVHNPASYLMKWRYLSKLWRLRPAVVFIGDYHATTYPAWAPGGERAVIPYGLPAEMCRAEPRLSPPSPLAIFTSNPLRSLDWLLGIWRHQIHSQVPTAELHLYCGAVTYGVAGLAKSGEMANVLAQAEALADHGVRLHPPVAKAKLAAIFRDARVMLYRGDLNETFCAAVAEAQAAGVPAVVQKLGSLAERVHDQQTGFVTSDDAAFAAAAVRILTDDDLWQRQHQAALQQQRCWTWAEAATAFERLIPV